MKNIHAFTELHGEPYPGYVSINEPTEDAQLVALTVRERGHNGLRQATLTLTREQALQMANDVIAKLDARRG